MNTNESNSFNEKTNEKDNMIIGLFYGGFTILGMFSGAIIGLFVGMSRYGANGIGATDSRILELVLVVGFLGTGIGVGLGIISNAIIIMRSRKRACLKTNLNL